MGANGDSMAVPLLLLFFYYYLAGMIIHVDKCCTFGVKKVSSKSAQIQPKLFINNESVPCVKLDESFQYLAGADPAF